MSQLPEFIINRYELWNAVVDIVLTGEDILPPSINVMYQNRRGGGLVLTPVGKAYINKMRQVFAEHFMFEKYPRWAYYFHMFVIKDTLVNDSFVQEFYRAKKASRPMRTHMPRKNKNTGAVEQRPAFTDLLAVNDADAPLKKVQDVFFECMGAKDHWSIISSAAKLPKPPGGEVGMELYLIPLSAEEVKYVTQVNEEVINAWTTKPI